MNKTIKVYEIGENIKEILVDDERSGNAIKILDTLEEKSKNLIIRHKLINSETHFLINFEKFSDEDFNNIANKLCESQKTLSGTKRKNIPNSLLFIYKINKSIKIAKVEESDVINRETLEMKKEFLSAEKYFKFFSYTKENQKNEEGLHEVITADKNIQIAKYWTNSFLEIERIRDSHVNTKDLIRQFNNKEIFDSCMSENDIKEIQEKFKNYVSNNEKFDLHDFEDEIKSEKKWDISWENSKKMFDNEKIEFDFIFQIDPKVIEKSLSGLMIANTYATIKSKNLTVAKNEGYIQYWENENKHYFIVIIENEETILEARGYERFIF